MSDDPKKTALRQFSTGLYLMTASDGEVAAGNTVSWVSQASFEPRLVMVAVKATSRLHSLVEKTGTFALGVFSSSQKDMAQTFFKPAELSDGMLAGHAVEAGPRTGAPIPLDLPYWLEARVTDWVQRGDHTVFVAEVLTGGVRDASARPLEMSATGWSYGG